jgi:hypothetical protein
VWDSLPNLSDKTQCCFSPNEKIVLTGTSAVKNKALGKLMGFSTLTGERMCDTDVCDANVTTVSWHPVLN